VYSFPEPVRPTSHGLSFNLYSGLIMGRRNQSDEATFTDNTKSARKAKSYEPGTYRLAPHSKTRVAYFHDESVGNYHYGVCCFVES
jgi:hypothetical protein